MPIAGIIKSEDMENCAYPAEAEISPECCGDVRLVFMLRDYSQEG